MTIANLSGTDKGLLCHIADSICLMLKDLGMGEHCCL